MKQVRFRKQTHRHPRERGAILVVALIMLVLITMISIATVRNSTMDERMAGGSRDRNKAFQAAEFALRSCLSRLQAGTYLDVNPTALAPAIPPAPQVWEVEGNWTSTTNSSEVTMSGAGLVSNPRCMFETLIAGGSPGTGSYRITVRAKGAADTTAVILQATYSAE